MGRVSQVLTKSLRGSKIFPGLAPLSSRHGLISIAVTRCTRTYPGQACYDPPSSCGRAERPGEPGTHVPGVNRRTAAVRLAARRRAAPARTRQLTR